MRRLGRHWLDTSPTPVTARGGTQAAKNGTSAPMAAQAGQIRLAGRALGQPAPGAAQAARRSRVGGAAAEPGGDRDPLLERQAREVWLLADARHQAAPGEVRRRPAAAPSVPSLSTRRPLPPGSSRSRSARSSRTKRLSSRWNPSSRRPMTVNDRLSLAGASRRRARSQQRAEAAGQAGPLVDGERLRAPVRVDRAGRQGLLDGGPVDRQLP